jgi:hypothetical protein
MGVGLCSCRNPGVTSNANRVDHFLNQGLFLRWILSKSRGEDEVDGGNTFGHGVHDIQGFVLSHLWVPL